MLKWLLKKVRKWFAKLNRCAEYEYRYANDSTFSSNPQDTGVLSNSLRNDELEDSGEVYPVYLTDKARSLINEGMAFQSSFGSDPKPRVEEPLKGSVAARLMAKRGGK